MKNKKIIERQYKNIEEGNEIKKFVIIAISVLLFFGGVYLLAGILTGEIKFKSDENKEVTIQYSEILAESTFKQSDKEYYVIYYDFDSNEAMLIDAISADLSSDSTLYKVDLSKNFNKNYISTDGKVNTSQKSIKELKVVSPTLIKIKDKKVVKFQKGIDKIKEFAMK